MRCHGRFEVTRLVARPSRPPKDQPCCFATGLSSKSHRDSQVREEPIRVVRGVLIRWYSCLYHTINILLNRAKLKLSREPSLATAIAEHNPLIQCISSATSIVALFDLYHRTFGEGHVVLALAYSVYTAASIFLLEVQAVGHAAPSTLERLSLCVRTLERLRATSPGMVAQMLSDVTNQRSSSWYSLDPYIKGT